MKRKPGNCSQYCRVSRSLPPLRIGTRISRLLNSAAGFLDENDLWIAATALVMNATLVTRDGDFRAIEGLALMEP